MFKEHKDLEYAHLLTVSARLHYGDRMENLKAKLKQQIEGGIVVLDGDIHSLSLSNKVPITEGAHHPYCIIDVPSETGESLQYANLVDLTALDDVKYLRCFAWGLMIGTAQPLYIFKTGLYMSQDGIEKAKTFISWYISEKRIPLLDGFVVTDEFFEGDSMVKIHTHI